MQPTCNSEQRPGPVGGLPPVPPKKNSRAITEGAYRKRRVYLADHVFADPGVGSDAPTDLLGPQRWSALTDLPTDVLLRTTDHSGRLIKDMLNQASAWLEATPLDPDAWPFIHDAYLDTY